MNETESTPVADAEGRPQEIAGIATGLYQAQAEMVRAQDRFTARLLSVRPEDRTEVLTMIWEKFSNIDPETATDDQMDEKEAWGSVSIALEGTKPPRANEVNEGEANG